MASATTTTTTVTTIGSAEPAPSHTQSASPPPTSISTTATADSSRDEKTNLTLTIEFTGGLELLFNNVAKHQIQLPQTNAATNEPVKVRDLIPWLCENLMVDSRREMFVLDGAIRPGILVLINDADWELEGEEIYELQEGDCVLFVSTLHGG